MINKGLHLQNHCDKKMRRVLSFWGPEVDATVDKINIDNTSYIPVNTTLSPAGGFCCLGHSKCYL
jgi:hypothetical protein